MHETTRIMRRRPQHLEPAVRYLHQHERRLVEAGMMPERRATIVTRAATPSESQAQRLHRAAVIVASATCGIIGCMAAWCQL